MLKVAARVSSAFNRLLGFAGQHPTATGICAFIGIVGFVVSLIGFRMDRAESQATTDQVESVRRQIENLGDQIDGQKRDWQVLDRTFYGLQIGGKIQAAYDLNYERISRQASGSTKIIKWRLPNKNVLTVHFDGSEDRILLISVHWAIGEGTAEVGISDFTFGKTTLDDIRERFGSNGFNYVLNMISDIEKGAVLFNAFELKDTPSIIVVLESFVSNAVLEAIDKLPHEQQQIGNIGDRAVLSGVSVADESYLDERWGENKIYDPKSNLIELN